MRIAYLPASLHRPAWRIVAAAIIGFTFFKASPAQPMLGAADAHTLGMRIWQNEGARDPRYLLWWNEGEAFASLGIGHFIWYPAGTSGPFIESFPRLLSFLERSGVALPPWLIQAKRTGNPWPSRRAFFAALSASEPRTSELRTLLSQTVSEQARFILKRLPEARESMLATAPHPTREVVERRFNRFASFPQGLYLLVDYLNFKGDGTQPSETYGGRGWGLLQVLSMMQQPSDDSEERWLDAFADAAERVLERRIENSPPARNERRWLPGWKRRISTYRPLAKP